MADAHQCLAAAQSAPSQTYQNTFAHLPPASQGVSGQLMAVSMLSADATDGFADPQSVLVAWQKRVKCCANVHCRREDEKTWRRAGGQNYCNACACYLKEHSRQRPLHLIQRAARRSLPSQLEEAGSQTLPQTLQLDPTTQTLGSKSSLPKPYTSLKRGYSCSVDEDYLPMSSLRIAGQPKRSKRAKRPCSRTSSLDGGFIAGVPDSPSASSCEGDALQEAALRSPCMRLEEACDVLSTLCADAKGWSAYLDSGVQQQAAKIPAHRPSRTNSMEADEGEVKRCANCTKKIKQIKTKAASALAAEQSTSPTVPQVDTPVADDAIEAFYQRSTQMSSECSSLIWSTKPLNTLSKQEKGQEGHLSLPGISHAVSI
ncbi:hypothetical protein WJX73_001499 [Symbiochloris irregularis]|uniref:GATA-type domain-containing protein n=1 Tax=Symbiochloris irregularis TaxID=706552 RepID=A0AAW1NS63_9CHLO